MSEAASPTHTGPRFRTFAALIAGIILAWCAFVLLPLYLHTRFEEHVWFFHLKLGMPIEEVRSVLGEPDDYDKLSSRTTGEETGEEKLRYGPIDGGDLYWITLQARDGKLIYWEYRSD